MHDPQPKGHWTNAVGSHPYRHLVPGQQYRVMQTFVDYDGVAHLVGETWWYLGYNASAYHDGLSLFISFDNEHEWHVRMSTHPEDQGPIVNALVQYVKAV